ncbi:hypothetical protein [Streptomyces endophytica]|uniref:Uncharacterized protein n=1 Tax=Streptomyces endophytica TaxID=2991496 RepID=A0ABY6PJ85_9ACTN|nr:hypothetical protein [Streptomyces endophytica]UZJ33485.1 hypothetical protein OJ254_28430 [Streptomyces endophytica]
MLTDEGGRRVLLGGEGDQGTVLLDVGRIGSAVEPLLGAAGQVVLVARGGAEPLTHVSAYGLKTKGYGGRLTLAVVGPCPYSADEIAQSLAIEQVVFLPWDTKTVAAMNRRHAGRLRTTGFRVMPMMAAACKLARHLAESRQQKATVVGAKTQRRLGPVAGDEGVMPRG